MRGVGEIRISDVYQRPEVETAVHDWLTSPEGKKQQENCVAYLTDEVACVLHPRSRQVSNNFYSGYRGA